MTASFGRLVTGLSLSFAVLAGCGGEQVERRPEKVQREFVCPTPGKALEPSGLDESMMPRIWQILNDDNQRGCWGSAVMAIGYIGSSGAFERLRVFIEGRGAELALAEDLVLLQQAYLSLGRLAQGGGIDANNALDYLIWSTIPQNWEKHSTDWRIDAVMRRELVRTLTLSAVQALGKLNSEKAHQHLLQMAVDSADRRSLWFKYQESASASDIVVSLINLHVLPPGRVAFATTEVLQNLKGDDDDDLRKLVQRVHGDAMEAFKLERAWLAARLGEEEYMRALRKADAIADARLSGLHGQLESLRHLLDSAEEQEAIDRVAQVVFPEGPLNLINAEVTDQVRRALAALAVLQERFDKDLKDLKLVDHVRTAKEAHEDLDRAQKLGTSGKGYETVIVKRSELQTSLRALIATVVAKNPGFRPGDRQRQHKVLAAILDQDDQVGSYLSRLVPVRDIDPTTGAELAPLVDEGNAGLLRRRRPAEPPPPPPEGAAPEGGGELFPGDPNAPDDGPPVDQLPPDGADPVPGEDLPEG